MFTVPGPWRSTRSRDVSRTLPTTPPISPEARLDTSTWDTFEDEVLGSFGTRVTGQDTEEGPLGEGVTSKVPTFSQSLTQGTHFSSY